MSCPYSEYRASGVEWLSDIPEHWELARIADIFAARSGGTPSTSEDTYWEGDIPWVSAKDMKTLRIADTQDHISEEAVNASATTLVPPGTVLLVARSGILRHTLPVGLAQCEVAINQDIKGLIPSMELVEPLYFVYWAYGLQAALLTLWRQQGATVESLDFDSVRATTCSLPPLHEQRAIAAFLDRETERIDALVERKRRLIERLQEYRTALITRTVTRGLPPEAARAAGLDPSPRMKPSGVEWLGDVPEHWKLKRLKHVSHVRYGLAEPPPEDPEGPPIIRATNVKAGRICTVGLLRVCAKAVPGGRNAFLAAGEIIVVRSGAYTGDSAIVPPKYEGSVAGYDMVVRVVDGDPCYLAWQLLGQTVLNAQFHLRSMRAAQPHLNAEDIEEVWITFPPLHEQELLKDYLDNAEGRIAAAAEQATKVIERLQEYRTALITAAVTGKIDVREAEPVAAPAA